VTTIRSQFIARIEAVVPAAGPVYADQAPEEPAYPHVVVSMDPQMRAETHGDGGVLAYRHTVHVDLWQSAAVEDETLGVSLRNALVGWKLAAPGMRAMFESSARAADPQFGLVWRELVLTVIVLT
jgi:hypothetical protein